MNSSVSKGLLALGLILTCSSRLLPIRIPSVRTSGQKSSGSRIDQTVPYLTNGKNAFQGYNVAPQIKSSPSVSDKTDPGAKPVYNLPFYGGRQAFWQRLQRGSATSLFAAQVALTTSSGIRQSSVCHRHT